MKYGRRAHAKINLGLRVYGKQSDGYHQISTVMQRVDLFDSITAQESDAFSISVEGDTIVGENLITRAASAFFERYPSDRSVRIHVVKRIPVAAGLGGGSSDAAATLLILREMFQPSIPLHALFPIALALGSDVPFFLGPPACLASGRGEILTPVPPLPSGWIVLSTPETRVSTEEVYREFDIRGMPTYSFLDPQELVRDGRFHLELLKFLGNDLEVITQGIEPLVAELHSVMRRYSDVVMMSGSGPAVFSIHQERQQADRCADDVSRLCRRTWVVSPITELEE
ncbi:MAG: 4-(cytidine 5'-diphospho)-2-C-methyl-D-erythritol kinase [Bacillota bacterium]